MRHKCRIYASWAGRFAEPGEKGAIAHSMVGRHRRLKAEDVFAYKAERDKIRSKAMDKLIADGADLY